MRNGVRQAHRRRRSLSLLLACTLSACTTQTGTRVRLAGSSLARVKTVGLVVKVDSPFSVLLSQERATATGALIGSYVGAAIEAGVLRGADEGIRRRLAPALGDFDLYRQLTTNLVQRLDDAHVFPATTVLEGDALRAGKQVNVDAVLEVTVPRWGLVVCHATEQDDRLQVGIVAHEQMIDQATGQLLWDRNEFHLDSDCRTQEEYEARPELL